MCRWLTYIGKPQSIEKLIYDKPNSLVVQSYHSSKAKLGVHGDGVGIAWYSNASKKLGPGLYRDESPAWNNHNLQELCHQIISPLFFSHVRASTGAPSLYVNCHPFRYKNWVFMHNGQIGDYHLIQRDYEQSLSDHAYSYRHGNTDSEMMFLSAADIGFCENSILDNIEEEDKTSVALKRLFLDIQDRCKKKSTKKPIRATLALSNGTTIWIVRWSSDSKSPSLYIQEEEDGTTIVSEPLDSIKDNWRAITENSLTKVQIIDNKKPIIYSQDFL